jgi:cytosine/adenosine deaminase-related metal-dependent hydrolase
MILRADWIAPVSEPPLRDAYIAFDEDRIAAIGPASTLPDSAEVLELGAVILTPGLINAHTHLELTCHSGRLPRGPLWPWITALIVARREAGEAGRSLEQDGIVDGAWESLRCGVTCVGDITRTGQSWRILKPHPIRKVCFVELISIAADPPRTLAELGQVLDDIDTDDRLIAGVSPHAPYTVTAEDLRATYELAGEAGYPWTMHCAETLEEIAFLSGTAETLPAPIQAGQRTHGLLPHSSGLRGFLEDTLDSARGGLLAHANYATADDAVWMAQHNFSVAYCPRAHAYFGHAQHPYRQLMAAGSPVVLATDSRASNENLSLLEECQHVQQHDPDAPSADVLLEMVTIRPAESLGLSDRLGSLEVGKQADLAAFAFDPNEIDESPLDRLIRTAPAASAVWIAGRQVSW